MKNICLTFVRQVRSRAIAAGLAGFLPLIALLASISVSFTSQAQGLSLGGAQNISSQDLNALKSSMGMGGLGLSGGSGAGANFFGSGMGGATLLALPPAISDEEQVDPNKKDTNKRSAPLPPNEFQKYVLEVTGKALPLYGADFFESLNNSNAQFARSPVGDDYVLGAGDQLFIRVWGSTSGETQATIGFNGKQRITLANAKPCQHFLGQDQANRIADGGELERGHGMPCCLYGCYNFGLDAWQVAYDERGH
jgi:hypothetical protein